MAGVMVDTNIFYILSLGPIEEARLVAETLEGKKLYTIFTVITFVCKSSKRFPLINNYYT